MNIHCVCRSFCSLVLISALPALLSACGQYGDLYLPEKPPSEEQQAQPAAPPSDAPSDRPDQADQPGED
jgi:predicted small lipoprotein YifL